MRVRMLVPLWVVVLGACSPEAQSPAAAPAPAAVAPSQESPRSAQTPQPAALQVLQDVYGVAFRNAGGERLDSGVFAGYWADARVPGTAPRPVFVALTEETPGPEQASPKASDQVGLSGALYRQDASGQWRLQVAQKAFGRFGAREEAPVLGDVASSVWLKVADDRVIWAVPTVVPAMGGARSEGYELVGVDWGRGQLTHLGSLPAGERAPVDCLPDARPDVPQACYGWTVRLSLVPGASDNGWPALAAAHQGSRYDDARKAVVSVDDSGVYVFDATRGAYLASRQ